MPSELRLAVLLLAVLAAAGAGVFTAGCTTARPPSPDMFQARSPQAPAARPTTIASVARQPITTDQALPLLMEAAGGAVLEELALDRVLQRELDRAGLAIDRDDTDDELRRLFDNLRATSAIDDEQAGALIDDFRLRRGLGPRRFELLLRRNAALRRLVQPIAATPAEVELAMTVRTTPRHAIRLMAIDGPSEASTIRRRLAETDRPLAEAFASLAMDHSRHPSSRTGGRLEPFSLADPAVPLVVRNTAADLEPGQLSTVIADGDLYLLVLLEEVLEADTTPAQLDRPAIAEQIRERKERVAMDRLARALLQRAGVSTFDRALEWSWRARAGGAAAAAPAP